MKAITPEITLGEIVTERPGSARILESLNLDYCCGGRRSLAVACSETGVDPVELIKRLDDAPARPTAAWAAMNPSQLVDHLEATHHAYLRAELPRLGSLTNKVAHAHGERHPELIDVQETYAQLRSDLEPHLMKEEQVLFPMIRELDGAETAPQFHCGTLRNPISAMMSEHDRAGELLAELRRLTHDFSVPADGCASYQALYGDLAELESDTHMHVHKENNLLFPAVLAMEAELSRA